VTATVAVEPTGKTVYMGAVGCYTSPSIGNSDALFSLDAATGTAHWIYRTESIEQYHDDAPFYHDFGFLNGPLLINGANGSGGTRPLVLGASKDGTMYAVDPRRAPRVELPPVPGRLVRGLRPSTPPRDGHTTTPVPDHRPDWRATSPYAFSDRQTPKCRRKTPRSSAAVANGLSSAPTWRRSTTPATPRPARARRPCRGGPGPVRRSIVDGVVYVGYRRHGGARLPERHVVRRVRVACT
jgi:hypothetical protein